MGGGGGGSGDCKFVPSAQKTNFLSPKALQQRYSNATVATALQRDLRS